MLDRRFRLVHSEDFRAAREAGKRWRNDLLVLNTVAGDQQQSRFGFVVNKQVGSATVRNLLKRRLRSAIRNRLPEISAGYNVVIVARPQAAASTYQQLVRSLDALLIQGNLLATTQ
jgi:ribonuclease P protein component